MGNIEKRGPNSWRIGVQVTSETGRTWVRRTLKFNAAMSQAQQRRQAEKALHQLELDVENGNARPDSSMTMRDLCELWMSRHVIPNLAPVTVKNYRHLLDARILPRLGDVPVDKITPGMLADFMADVKREGRIRQMKPEDELAHGRRSPRDASALAKNPAKPLSDKTMRTYYDTVFQIFEKAVAWEIIWRNPMRNVHRPHNRRKPVKFLDDEQAVQLLRCLSQEPCMEFRCAVLLALTCGLRLGEVGGLMWSDVNWSLCTIDISKALKYTPQTGNFLDVSKTPSADRKITLPAGMMAVLAETLQGQQWKAAQMGDRWRNSGRIVCAWDGAPLHHDTPSKQFRAFADRNGFEGVRYHDLRHTHATLLFANNIDAVAVASRLGHAKADTTLRIYAHALKRRDTDSAQAMQGLFDTVPDLDRHE